MTNFKENICFALKLPGGVIQQTVLQVILLLKYCLSGLNKIPWLQAEMFKYFAG